MGFAYGYEKGFLGMQRFDDVPIPKPGNNQVVLQVEAAGLCMSDPHILIVGPMKNRLPDPERFIMGHEVAGQIYEVGDGLKDNEMYAKGKRFCLFIGLSCGVCQNCRSGKDNACLITNHAYGLNHDGGFQLHILIDNLRSLLPIPDGVSYEAAAVATDSVLTPFHAIQKVQHLIKPTSKVVVFGLGGLGLNAVQILKHYNPHIVACDVKPELERHARSIGVDEFYTDLTKSNHEIESFDFCFDFVGIQPTSDACQTYVKNQGKIVTVGLGKYRLTVKNFELARREVEYIFCFGGTSQEQIECMHWIEKGKIKPVLSIEDFNDLPDWVDKLASGEVEGRVVFRPAKASKL